MCGSSGIHSTCTSAPRYSLTQQHDCAETAPQMFRRDLVTAHPRHGARCIALRSAQGRCDSSPSRAGAAGPAHASAFTGTSRWGSGTFTPPTRNPGELLSYLRSLKDSSIPVKRSGHGDLIKSTSVQGQSPRDSGNLFHWGNWSSDWAQNLPASMAAESVYFPCRLLSG